MRITTSTTTSWSASSKRSDEGAAAQVAGGGGGGVVVLPADPLPAIDAVGDDQYGGRGHLNQVLGPVEPCVCLRRPEPNLRSAHRAKAPTAPMRMVIPMEMFCLPGRTRRARGPMMMPANNEAMIVPSQSMRAPSLGDERDPRQSCPRQAGSGFPCAGDGSGVGGSGVHSGIVHSGIVYSGIGMMSASGISSATIRLET